MLSILPPKTIKMPYECNCSEKDCMPCAAIMGKCEQGCDCGYCVYGKDAPKSHVSMNPCELCMLRMLWQEEEEERYQAGACDCEVSYDMDYGEYVMWPCDFCQRRMKEEEAVEELTVAMENMHI